MRLPVTICETLISPQVGGAIGRRRLSPPRGAGWEPANALPDGISRAEKSHTSQHCPLARATARARAQGSGPLTPRTGDKGTI
ncbi:hypothetical protein N7533_010573 [Penicillium manginii]|uniref:uncharacterized protein n=1 Tax=Penicillium manginii TaxID=203109 RepID=UPI0025498E05|nr:uncharacterized protein N7533_010573 [Penicillium manginii]KAJ5743471.1 hypothetical protein N7533_010573 [Penicillium manginii]